jgi:hypothetical protein
MVSQLDNFKFVKQKNGKMVKNRILSRLLLLCINSKKHESWFKLETIKVVVLFEQHHHHQQQQQQKNGKRVKNRILSRLYVGNTEDERTGLN